jgi:hypothetical protein
LFFLSTGADRYAELAIEVFSYQNGQPTTPARNLPRKEPT